MPLREIFKATEPTDVEAAQRRLALAQALQQQAMQPRVPVSQGPVASRYGAGNALVDLAGALASAYNVKKANEAYTRAKTAQGQKLSGAMQEMQASTPDAQVGAQAVQNLRNTGANDLPQEVVPQSEAAGNLASAMGPDAQQQLAAAMLSRSMTAPKYERQDLGDSVGLIDERGNVVKRIPKGPAPQGGTDDQREYMQAVVRDGYKGTLQQWLLDQKKAGAPSVNVNTEKSLYGTLADKQASQYSELYGAAQSAPEAIARAGRIRELLKTQPYTGSGAGYKLAIGKGARALGFNFAQDDTANTEALAAEMARSTLDMVKSSGLAGSQGLTEGERKFLMQAVAGEISLEPETISRLSDLNERTARNTLNRWNDTASRLKKDQLDAIGMAPIAQPPPPSGNSPKGKLTQNPDGSFTYTP